jgi:hypothetical protein
MIKFATYKNQVKLGQGQSLHFQPGRGYFAGPILFPHHIVPIGPGPAEPKSGQGPGGPYTPRTATMSRPPAGRVVTPPPGGGAALPPDPYAALDPATIDSRAGQLAQSQLDPQEAEARRQQELAAQQAAQDEAAIQGFQTAASGLISKIPDQISGAYDAAAGAIGDLGKGVGGAIGGDLSAEQAGSDAFAAGQGQSGGTSANGDVSNVVDMLGGVIPGTQFAQEGAGLAASYAIQSLIPLNAGREELASRMAQARQSNDQYAQQLLSIAAQYPGLKAQALQQLNQYELDKSNAREQKRVDTANITSQQRQDATQARAERASETAAGVSAANAAETWKYKWASLQFQSQKAAAAAKAAAAKGKRIDTANSKLLGHIVYMDGSEDPSIKVKQSNTNDPVVKAKQNRAKAIQTARTTAFSEAKKSLGTPTMTDKDTLSVARTKGVRVGRYIADPSQKYGVAGGVFPPAYPGGPATTNNPARATRKGGAQTYAQAQSQVWAAIAGDSLMARYNLSREQVMAIVNRQLTAAGWKK